MRNQQNFCVSYLEQLVAHLCHVLSFHCQLLSALQVLSMGGKGILVARLPSSGLFFVVVDGVLLVVLLVTVTGVPVIVTVAAEALVVLVASRRPPEGSFGGDVQSRDKVLGARATTCRNVYLQGHSMCKCFRYPAPSKSFSLPRDQREPTRQPSHFNFASPSFPSRSSLPLSLLFSILSIHLFIHLHLHLHHHHHYYYHHHHHHHHQYIYTHHPILNGQFKAVPIFSYGTSAPRAARPRLFCCGLLVRQQHWVIRDRDHHYRLLAIEYARWRNRGLG